MQHRSQRTISRPAEVCGVGFITGVDVRLHFLPAPANHGITFRRVDLHGSDPIPARIEYAIPRQRRTAIAKDGAVVELTEHVLAALAGLQVDNCRIELNAPEPPGCDGSSLAFAEAILEAGVVELGVPQPRWIVNANDRVVSDDGKCELTARPLARPSLAIGYQLDYGPRCPIQPQNLFVEITPESFMSELAFCRTFVLESEVVALKALGYGTRTTYRDLLVFGPDGVIDNELHLPDECVRHKILDCLGDFALLGCDIQGRFEAFRSGHELNRDIVACLRKRQTISISQQSRKAA